jgi:probable HAF family extracellular repeat protein
VNLFLRRAVVVAFAVPVALLTTTPASAAVVVADLGMLSGHVDSEARSVRDDGTAVGHSTESDGGLRAVVFAGGTVTELATPGRNSAANDINDAGVIVGEAEPAGIERPYSVWWDDDGALHELPGGHPGTAYAVNDEGVVVGLSDAQGLWPLRWASPTTPAVRLATLPGGENYAAAHDVNTEGTAVGFSLATDGTYHAVRWDAAGAIERLDDLAGHPTCRATAINDAGISIGTCRDDNGPVAVYWDGAGTVTALPSLGGETQPTGISDAGTIVGSAEDADGRYHAVRWGAFGITRLATLGGTHGVALDINDTGTVVGRTHSSDNVFHATEWRNAG